MNRKLLSVAVLAVATSLSAPLVLADWAIVIAIITVRSGRSGWRRLIIVMIMVSTAAGTRTSTGFMIVAITMSVVITAVMTGITRNTVPARPRPSSSGA